MTQSALLFADDEALLVALSAGWIPPEIAAQPAAAVRSERGLLVAASVPLGRTTRASLRKLGLEEAPLEGEPFVASSWAELVAPRARRDAGTDAATIVFELPASGVAALAAEILRLGCPRQELRMVGERALIRVVEPPYYSVARALDGVGGVRALRPASSSAGAGGRVLVQLGYEHPLAERLVPRPDVVVLVWGEGPWTLLPDGPFEELSAHFEISVSSPPSAIVAATSLPRIPVELRLGRAARSRDATTFVLPGARLAELESFVRGAPDSVVAGLSFAAARDGSRLFVRARPGVVPGASPVAGAEAFAEHPQIPNLLCPCDAVLEPPVRRDRLVELLAPDPSELAFVRPGSGEKAGKGVVVERLAEAAFVPLASLVDYVVGSATALDAWRAGVLFDFDAITVEDVVAPKPARERERPAPEPDPAPATQPTERRRAKKAERAREVPAATPVVPEPVVVSEAAASLAAREAEFLALESPADDPARVALYTRMAELLSALDRRRDATLCVTRALWEADAEDAKALATLWARREVAGPPDVALRGLLAQRAPSADQVRAAVACLLADAHGGSPDSVRRRSATPRALESSELARWLDRHDSELDVRSIWLSRLAVSRLAGGDRLGLARARDRVLTRLASGLSLERDVPSFLRFVGEGRESRHAERLVLELSGLRERYAKTSRKRSAVEAKPELTRAYVDLAIATGLARLGASERARALASQGEAALDLSDPVHGFLVRAYRARVEQALEGARADAALPPALMASLERMERFVRYKVDRLRQASQILAPDERLDPIASFHRAAVENEHLAELAAVRGDGVDGREARLRAIEGVLARARGAEGEARAELLAGLLRYLPEVGESDALLILTAVTELERPLPPIARARVLEGVLRVAGHFAHGPSVRAAEEALHPVLRALGPEQATDLAALVGGALRVLRRVGLRDEAASLLRTISEVAAGDAPQTLAVRLHAAGGLAYLGREQEARPTIELALAHLGAELPIGDRLLLVRTLSTAIGRTSERFALPALRRLEAELPRVTDSFNTNSHFCLSVVAFVEALVLGYASDELALGEFGRRFLDEDEHLVRRRLQRDLEM